MGLSYTEKLSSMFASITPDEKVKAVTAWFNEVDEIIADIKELTSSTSKHHDKTAILTLYALLERMASFRYRSSKLGSGKKFKKILLDYSGDKAALEKIDLAFLGERNCFIYTKNKSYIYGIKKIHNKIIDVLNELYGTIEVGMKNRFIELDNIHAALLSKQICPTCLDKNALKLYSVHEVIYRFGRCKAVHEGEFITVGFITLPFLIYVVQNITNNLRGACIAEKKWAYEL